MHTDRRAKRSLLALRIRDIYYALRSFHSLLVCLHYYSTLCIISYIVVNALLASTGIEEKGAEIKRHTQKKKACSDIIGKVALSTLYVGQRRKEKKLDRSKTANTVILGMKKKKNGQQTSTFQKYAHL